MSESLGALAGRRIVVGVSGSIAAYKAVTLVRLLSDRGAVVDVAMTPAASVSGFYLSHPDSTYFNVGRIGPDQLQDQARRRGAEVSQLERLLAPNL